MGRCRVVQPHSDRSDLRRARLFGLGRFVAIAVLATIALLIVESSRDVSEDYAEIGGLAVLTSIKQLRSSDATGRSAEGKESKLLTRLDSLSIIGAFGIGIARGVVVIKNIPPKRKIAMIRAGTCPAREVNTHPGQALTALLQRWDGSRRTVVSAHDLD